MLKDIKKLKLITAMALLVQAFTAFIMFIILAVKNRSVAFAFLAVAGMCGIAGGWLMTMHRLEEEAEDRDFHDLMHQYQEGDDFPFSYTEDDDDEDEPAPDKVRRDIPVDDTVDETEFDH